MHLTTHWILSFYITASLFNQTFNSFIQRILYGTLTSTNCFKNLIQVKHYALTLVAFSTCSLLINTQKEFSVSLMDFNTAHTIYQEV